MHFRAQRYFRTRLLQCSSFFCSRFPSPCRPRSDTPAGASFFVKSLQNSSWALLEVTKVFFFSARRLPKSAREAILRVPELASARSWLPGRFLEGLWLQNGAILASKMVFFCYLCLPFWVLFLAWIFGRFSLHLCSEFWLFWVWREKGAEGFRLVKTNGFSIFFNVCEAAGRAARQGTEYQKQP